MKRRSADVHFAQVIRVVATERSGASTLTSLLRVTLRTQPSDAAITDHPLVDFGFAFEARNVNRFDIRTLGQDIPVVFRNPHRFETYFCFGHSFLWQQFEMKSKGAPPAKATGPASWGVRWLLLFHLGRPTYSRYSAPRIVSACML